jgi:four helix bundle protein
MMPYERSSAWKACHDLVLALYRTTESWPRHELFGLTSQSRRAAYSAAANIAEGMAKQGTRELRRYLDISLGSLHELSYALRVARDLNLGERADVDKLEALHTSACKLTWAYYASVNKKKNSEG